MTSNVGQIKQSQIVVQPSQKLKDYIRALPLKDNTPLGIRRIQFKNKPKDEPTTATKQVKLEYLTSDEDRKFISSLDLKDVTKSTDSRMETGNSSPHDEKLLTLLDLHWLYAHIKEENEKNTSKVYLHELLENSEIILPKNEQIPRNEELEKRCKKLKAEQQNREYQSMTKNVDSFRRKLPEDTIGYQLRMMNSHLIAVFQFIASVVAGFFFGFIGIDLMTGTLDFGFRLMLGVVCALVVALAELYFLAKKLNEDLEFETMANKPDFSIEKLDRKLK